MNIEDYIPHRKPMVLIDEIKASDDISIRTEVTIRPDSLFQNEEGNVPAWIGIEYMAQSIAAYAGAKHMRKQELVKPGFLVGTRTFDAFTDFFMQGKTYIVDASQLFVDEGLGSFECHISEKETGEKCCYAKINVFEPDNTDNL